MCGVLAVSRDSMLVWEKIPIDISGSGAAGAAVPLTSLSAGYSKVETKSIRKGNDESGDDDKGDLLVG